LFLERLRLTNVRNHREFEVAFSRPLTVLTGGNGAGKTSVLEAAHLLLTGASPRSSSPREVISSGQGYLRVEGRLRRPGGEAVEAALAYDLEGERRATRDGAPLADLSVWEEELPVRAFLPDHLQLVKGTPNRRRAYIDLLGQRAHPGYRRVLSSYEDALRQRNFLLRQGNTGEQHDPWEGILAREGLELVRRRADVLAEIAPFFSTSYGLLAPGEAASLTYRTNVAELDSQAWRRSLTAERRSDRQRTFTRLGPHRDDLRFLLQGRDLRELGSQGEQRTVLLALLLSEREWSQAAGGHSPLLLLDDVMSELDYSRRRRLFSVLRAGGQALITTATLDYFTSDELASMAVVEIGYGPSPCGDQFSEEA
jgi:DNA replication and repair protein RecF